MLAWLGKKVLNSERQRDLEGLRQLPALERVKVTMQIVSRIEAALDELDKGTSQTEILSAMRQLRQTATEQASGYSDPIHLVGSLPDHFFGAISDLYQDEERTAVCRSIVGELESILHVDLDVLLLSKKERTDVYALFESFKRRLAMQRLL